MTNASTTATCSQCTQRDVCFPVDLEPSQRVRLDQLSIRRIRIKRGEHLFRDGDAFKALFTVRSGFFKTGLATETGHEQVTGFQMAGEMLGLDGIVTERHMGSAVALEDSEVCAIPYTRLAELSRELPAMQQHLHKAMSREIVREHQMMLLLGSMRAQERLATFLLNLVKRLHARGFSESELVLRMTRAEIGSYLGMKLETVSRLFSRLTQEGILTVHQRHVCIADAGRLLGNESQAAIH
ncbi:MULTISPECIES: helix-turn-helix domain-containing protein [unclassified Acidovorax]|uniref:helix-turn-helix domain-containing protein n=1 Tax=unclassified Acidovorax TaxID=2684926 RepID=UPI00070BB82F|nr:MULTISPECIES: helix-turn-helix domain-containing protein [unclassified Acidovorax]KRC19169.1 transcriptional regulator [Acidovorax sp. Root217]KRC20149.1 transcriptional regulator [Acidovorax sp. Root219]